MLQHHTHHRAGLKVTPCFVSCKFTLPPPIALSTLSTHPVLRTASAIRNHPNHTDTLLVSKKYETETLYISSHQLLHGVDNISPKPYCVQSSCSIDITVIAVIRWAKHETREASQLTLEFAKERIKDSCPRYVNFSWIVKVFTIMIL